MTKGQIKSFALKNHCSHKITYFRIFGNVKIHLRRNSCVHSLVLNKIYTALLENKKTRLFVGGHSARHFAYMINVFYVQRSVTLLNNISNFRVIALLCEELQSCFEGMQNDCLENTAYAVIRCSPWNEKISVWHLRQYKTFLTHSQIKCTQYF